MKIFVSFRYTGETYESLVEFFKPVCEELERAGHKVFCSLWKEEVYKQQKLSPKEILFDNFKEMGTCDVLLAIVRSSDRSEGMLMEVGYALANKKPVYAAVHSDVTTYISDVSRSFSRFSTKEDLLAKLAHVFV